MAHRTQPDHFGAAAQADLFGAAPAPSYLPDPAKVRTELHAILAAVRGATVLPWKPADVAYFRTVFPQMTNWLPDAEGKQLCFEFESELARLEAA